MHADAKGQHRIQKAAAQKSSIIIRMTEADFVLMTEAS